MVSRWLTTQMANAAAGAPERLECPALNPGGAAQALALITAPTS